MSSMNVFSIIAVVSLVTIVLRFLPFFIFSNKKTPEFIDYLGRYLPYAIMAMLVVYCLKEVNLIAMPYGIPEAIAVTVVVVFHVWKRNTLLSIVTGTICYMLLVQGVFL